MILEQSSQNTAICGGSSNKYRYPVRVKRFIVEYCTYALYICFTTLPVRLDDVQHGVRQSAFWDNIQPAQLQPGGGRL